jgi:potassium/hydrogen antiporter
VRSTLFADPYVLAGAALLIGALACAALADRVRVPGLLFFLGLGMLVGDDGLDLISLSEPRVVQAAGVVALLVILFEGGLSTKPTDLRRAALPGMALATAGVLVTAGVVALGVWSILDVDPTTAMLLGAVVASTDAAAVFSLLRSAPLPKRLGSLLEVESGSNDPVAITLTVGILEAWGASPAPLDWVRFALAQLGGGLLVGAAIGLAGSWLLARPVLRAGGFHAVLALGVGGLAYGAAALGGASGFLAVYVAGLLVGTRVPRQRRGILSFHAGLATMAEIGLFLLLGLLVFPSELPGVALPALAVTAVLVLLARPLAVFATLAPARYPTPELVLVTWAGLRGAVPIVLATFPLTAGHPAGHTIFNVVFFVVLVSTAIQGTTVAALARRLGLTEGAQPLRPVADAVPLDDDRTDLVELRVTGDLHVTGRELREIPLPGNALLAAIFRDGDIVAPAPQTHLLAGDRAIITVARRQSAVAEITAWARGETSAAPAGCRDKSGNAVARSRPDVRDGRGEP